jgi:glycosyltransferase involved in cell wall biosynthesis
MVAAIGLTSTGLRARLVLAGPPGDGALEETLRAMPGWTRVKAVGMLSRPEVMDLLGQARVGVVICRPTPAYLDAWPTKLFEYMLAGLPVVASDFPLWREIVHGAGCGVLVDPLDPIEIARALEHLLEHPEQAEAMGRRGREAVLARYNWTREEAKLLALYQRLGGGAPRSRRESSPA